MRRMVMGLLLTPLFFMFTACNMSDRQKTDHYNELAYNFHYRNLDSTLYYANRSMQLAGSYDAGEAEALNNKAFVSLARMQYELADRQLDSVAETTDNQVELLIADIQKMRLCQRVSRNKDFYTYREKALLKLRRIEEEKDMLNAHQKKRMIYARSEFKIVTSTDYYYVGLIERSSSEMMDIKTDGEIQSDTAQWLNYLYNVGAGGVLTKGSQHDINISEMDHLLRCYNMSIQYGYPFWTANSLQAMSEHLQGPGYWQYFAEESLYALKFLNIDNVPDSLLAGNLAERSLAIFQDYGDVYQISGAYRTMAQCYWTINDYEASMDCLNTALADSAVIFQAPDLVASIHEQQSVLYAAMDNTDASYAKREDYLEKQEQTRQDRYLESRAEQLRQSVSMLNMMIWAIVILMLVAILLSFFYAYMRRRRTRGSSIEQLLEPLQQWQGENEQRNQLLDEQYEETLEQQQVTERRMENSKRIYLEQRAKVALVNSVTPLIDRMLHEINRLANHTEDEQLRKERYAYIAELTEKINEYNAMLTQWIQLRQGDLRLHIESFPLQELFDIVAHAQMAFQLKNIQLSIQPTQQWVKADKVLTLFMINTIADNARKFTPEGGSVSVSAREADKYVEVSVEDTGEGMTEEQVAAAFSVEKKAIADEALVATGHPAKTETSHGFGLVNCKGIIEKYKKTSSLFGVCSIGVESEKGKGSRFYFRLPKGVMRALLTMTLITATAWAPAMAANIEDNTALEQKASEYAEHLTVSNQNGRYEETLQYADSAISSLNTIYRANYPQKTDTMMPVSANSVALPEINWYHDSIPANYQLILTIRNESAIASLALHDWARYRYNNKVYTTLFKEMSADNTLGEYCRVMQKSQANKYVAIIILVILALLILLAYFMLYYRHMVYYRFCVERVRNINDILLSDKKDEEKLNQINKLVEGNDKLPQALQEIVAKILDSLHKSIDTYGERMKMIGHAEDGLRRLQYEDGRLHVCNSVLDNCLSTLKHETMYYPSRIRNLIDDGDGSIQNINELAVYYKEIYTLLSAQAMRQVTSVKPECTPIWLNELLGDKTPQEFAKASVLGDKTMLAYMMEILRKQNGGKTPIPSVEEKGKGYMLIRFWMEQMKFSESECQELFNPQMHNLPFLLCRQIIRDTGEVTNARGCGIVAEVNQRGGTDVIVTLAKANKRQ